MGATEEESQPQDDGNQPQGEDNSAENSFSPKYLAPEHCPMAWLVINASILAYSLILFFMMVCGGPRRFVNFTKESYLWYDFITTAIWCLEAFLREWSSRTSHRRYIWMIRIELVLALYFVICSAISLYKFSFRTHKAEGDLINVVINAIAYAYMVFETGGMAVDSVLRKLGIERAEDNAEEEEEESEERIAGWFKYREIL